MAEGQILSAQSAEQSNAILKTAISTSAGLKVEDLRSSLAKEPTYYKAATSSDFSMNGHEATASLIVDETKELKLLEAAITSFEKSHVAYMLAGSIDDLLKQKNNTVEETETLTKKQLEATKSFDKETQTCLDNIKQLSPLTTNGFMEKMILTPLIRLNQQPKDKDIDPIIHKREFQFYVNMTELIKKIAKDVIEKLDKQPKEVVPI